MRGCVEPDHMEGVKSEAFEFYSELESHRKKWYKGVTTSEDNLIGSF